MQEKTKYWSKVLSDDAIWTLIQRTYTTYDLIGFLGDWILSDTLWSSLVLSLLLDIKLDEIIPINLLWDIELPSPEEFVRGVLLKPVPIELRIEIKEIAPEYEEVIEKPETLFEEPYRENVSKTRLRKSVFGQTTYGNSYYDPPAVYEFLRSTLLDFLKKPYDITTSKTKVDQTAETLNVHKELVANLFNRLQAITQVKEKGFTWDYGWWDRSCWAEEGSPGKINTITYELEVRKIPYDDLVETQIGGYWDLVSWDYFYWVEDIPESIHPYDIDKFQKLQLADIIVSNFKTRYLSTPYLVANYQRRGEREKFSPSDRVETFAVPTYLRYKIENLVKTILRTKGITNPIQMRLYQSAVLQLYGIFSQRHRWGDEMFHAMTEDELKDWWIGRWSKEGLNPVILEELYNRFRGRIRMYSDLRQKERLRMLRKRLSR